MGPLLGHPGRSVAFGAVHLPDVVAFHVAALTHKCEGNQDFIFASPTQTYGDLLSPLEVVKKRYAKEYTSGVFKSAVAVPPPDKNLIVDGSKASRIFGIKYKNFEDQVTSVIVHFLELKASSTK